MKVDPLSQLWGADAVGSLLAAGGALAFAVTIVCNRQLGKHHLGVATVLGVRFAVASVLLIAVLAVRRQPILPVAGERLRVIVLGGIGYMLESTLFYMGLERGSTAAVALLFYTYPAVVTVIELVVRRQPPDRRTVTALALSAVGILLVVGAGTEVTISAAGALFAIGSALSFAVYLFAGDHLVRRTPALTTSAWVAAGAAMSFGVRLLVGGGLQDTAGHWLLLLTNGAATAIAFTAMFAALRRLGAGRTSVVMTLEAFFAVVLAAIWLSEPVQALQAVGGLAILAAAVLVARQRATGGTAAGR